MKRLIPLYFLLFISVLTVNGQKLVEVGKGYSQTSVNTTVFRNNSVVTHKGFQYVAFYDENSYLVIGKRKIKTEEWILKRSQYKGNCSDAHNVISIMVDGKGFLHVSFDHHGNPLNYCTSIAPGSLELGQKKSMTGIDEGNVTYPEFYLLENGDLIFAYRSGSSGKGNLVLNRYEVKNQKWLRVQDVLIDGENQRNAYWQLYVDSKGTVHLSWVWRESSRVETNHDLCYARSFDGGKTWMKTSGEVYKLPITTSNAEYACLIPQKSELINQTSMSADQEGRPYIATYWRDKDSQIPNYRLVWYDGGEWKQQKIFERTIPFSLSGSGTKLIPIARPKVVIDSRKKNAKAYYIFRDEERGSKVSMAYTDDLTKGDWMVSDLTDFSVEAWEPSHDTELWKNKKKLQIYVQRAGQGDGEKTIKLEPQPIYILEVKSINSYK